MDCNEFELALIDQPDSNQLPLAAKAHLHQCEACASLVADFQAIAERVAVLSPGGPVPDMWPQIREQLLRDGIIHKDDHCDASLEPRLVRSTSSARR